MSKHNCCGQPMKLEIMNDGGPIYSYTCSVCKDGYSRGLEDVNKPDFWDSFAERKRKHDVCQTFT